MHNTGGWAGAKITANHGDAAHAAVADYPVPDIYTGIGAVFTAVRVFPGTGNGNEKVVSVNLHDWGILRLTRSSSAAWNRHDRSMLCDAIEAAAHTGRVSSVHLNFTSSAN